MTITSACCAGLQAASTASTRFETKGQAVQHGMRTGFSEVLGAGIKSPPPKADEIVERKLTGMLLGNLFQMMLPEEVEGVFAESGSAGMWNSFMADALAEGVNESGKIDLRLNPH